MPSVPVEARALLPSTSYVKITLGAGEWLAALHWGMRGRGVGRGDRNGKCVLLASGINVASGRSCQKFPLTEIIARGSSCLVMFSPWQGFNPWVSQSDAFGVSLLNPLIEHADYMEERE